MKYFRRLCLFIASRLLIILAILGILITVFYFSMNASNIYVILKDGMARRTQVIMMNSDPQSLSNYFSASYLDRDVMLKSMDTSGSVYTNYYDISGIDPVKPGRYSFLPDTGIPLEPSFIEKALLEVPDLPAAVCASGDKFVAGPEKKRALAAEFGADICDMESAAVALICYTNQIPCLMIKTVSDGIDSADRFYEELDRTSGLALDLADRIIRTLNV